MRDMCWKARQLHILRSFDTEHVSTSTGPQLHSWQHKMKLERTPQALTLGRIKVCPVGQHQNSKPDNAQIRFKISSNVSPRAKTGCPTSGVRSSEIIDRQQHDPTWTWTVLWHGMQETQDKNSHRDPSRLAGLASEQWRLCCMPWDPHILNTSSPTSLVVSEYF